MERERAREKERASEREREKSERTREKVRMSIYIYIYMYGVRKGQSRADFFMQIKSVPIHITTYYIHIYIYICKLFSEFKKLTIYIYISIYCINIVKDIALESRACAMVMNRAQIRKEIYYAQLLSISLVRLLLLSIYICRRRERDGIDGLQNSWTLRRTNVLREI